MTNNEFTLWLKGFFDLNIEPIEINSHQAEIIKNHLVLVEKVEGYLSEKNKQLLGWCQPSSSSKFLISNLIDDDYWAPLL